jgi:hypothetical protein
MKFIFSFLLCMIFTVNHANAAEKIASTYTNINACRITDYDKETGASSRICRGISGFDIKVLFDDDRMSIDLIFPDKNQHPLDYWGVATTSFSQLGEKAEWRTIQKNGIKVPIALIVKINSTQQQNVLKPKSVALLVVAKIQGNSTCVTDIVEASRPSANKEARARADQAQDKPCLQAQ